MSARESVGSVLTFRSAIRKVDDFIGPNNARLMVALAILAAIVAYASPYFLTEKNVVNVGQAVAVLGILVIAETIVVISGGLDLSVGSVPALCGVVAASLIASTHNPVVGLAGAVAVGAVAGLINGLLIVFGRVNAIIATLATLTVYEGVALVVSQGGVIGINDAAYNTIGSGRLLDIPIPVLILLVMAAGAHVFMRYTDYGRHVYAMGDNPGAARLAGLPLDRLRISLYVMAGAASGLAGIVLSARATGASPLQGQNLEFDVITAVFLGGTAMAGGRGTVAGAMLAVVILGTVYNGFILAQVPGFYQYIAKGVLLAGAVVIQERNRTR